MPIRLAALLALLAAPAAAEIEVRDPYAIASRPNAPSGAAFMVIANPGGPPDRLLAASSPAAERVELHTHSMDANGVMRMEEVEEGFDLPADGEIVMERGGAHLMFLGITEPFVDGATVPVTLTFEVAGEVEVGVPVELGRLAGDGAAQGGDHGAMDMGG